MKTNKIQEEIEELIIPILFFVGIVLIFFSGIVFYNGLHNADLVFNNQYFLAKQNKTIDNIYDMYNVNGNAISQKQLYIFGMKGMTKGFYLALIGGLLLGISINNIKFNKLK
jgi:hypothetical protein